MNADDERDAWLREALRHAPDAQLGAPAAVSECILRAAQTSAHRPPAPGALASLWAWLARPPFAAGLASVMVATLAGLMWWDRLDTPDRSQPDAVATQPAAAAASVAASPPPAASIAAPPPAIPAPPAAPPHASRKAAAVTADAAAPPPPAPAPAPMPAPVPAAEATPAPAVSGSLSAAPLAERRAKAALADSAGTPAPQRLDAGGMASLRQSLASEPERWSWQRGGGAAHSLDDRMTAWVGQLDAAAATRWQRSAAASPPASADALRLLRDGRLLHVLRIDAGRVHWESAEAGVPSTREATIGEAAAQALQAALDDATR
jgi:hypothetical protein